MEVYSWPFLRFKLNCLFRPFFWLAIFLQLSISHLPLFIGALIAVFGYKLDLAKATLDILEAANYTKWDVNRWEQKDSS